MKPPTALTSFSARLEVICIDLRGFPVAHADRRVARRRLAAGTARIAENALFQPREIGQVLIDEGIAGTAEALEPILDVGRIARLRHLAIIDQVDACIGLFFDDLGDGRLHPRRQGVRVDRDAFLLGVHHADQVVRPGQAAGVGGQETVTAALHGLNSRAQL